MTLGNYLMHYVMQAMHEVAAELQRQHPSLMLYDRKRKLEWAARLQASRLLRWCCCRVDA